MLRRKLFIREVAPDAIMVRAISRNLMIAALVLAIFVQFDTPLRKVLVEVADRISVLFTGSALGLSG